MKIFACVLSLLSVLSVSASAGVIQCMSVRSRHHVQLSLPDDSQVVTVLNENFTLHYKLSPESARRNRMQLPVVLESVNDGLILRIFQAGSEVHGTLKLRILDERVPMLCRYANM